MSPTIKLFISIGGAVLGHLLLFGMVGVLLLVSALIGPPKLGAPNLANAAEPKEITISFSELIEKMELLPPEEELDASKAEEEKADEPKAPEPEEEPEHDPNYIRTFADQESPDAPKNAAFESDRNTTAGTRVAPDLDDPEALKDLPSLDGQDDIPTFAMRDRKFIDGEFIDQESGGANTVASMGSPAQPMQSPPQKQSPDPFKETEKTSDTEISQIQNDEADKTNPDSPPETKKSNLPDGPKTEGEKRPEQIDPGQPQGVASEELKSPAEMAAKAVEGPENVVPELPADATEIPKTPGDEIAQPKTTDFAADARMDQAQETFTVPDSLKAPVISENVAPVDQTAIAERPAEMVGPPAAPETPQPAAAALPSAATAPLPPPSESEVMAAAQSPAVPAVQQTPPAPLSVPSPPINPTAVQNETPAFMPEMIQSRIKGTLSTEKPNAAVAAEKTPLGIYKRSVTDAIERKWHRYRIDNADMVEWGSMKISFRVDRNGKIQDLKLVENKANTVMAEFSLKAILHADIPKMPEGIADLLGPRGLSMDYDIYVH